MARLNEFAAPAESVEALKRRFVRQNREIARVNSMQSLRIRSLESEVSHLLAENVSLREQVINLTQEIERLEAAKLLNDGISEIKGRLDTKLMELNSLVADLGTLPRRVGNASGEKSEQSMRSRATATESRPRMTDPESHLGADDGKLPAILEDKCYPRRTLENEEIRNLMHASSDSAEPPQDTPLTQEEAESTMGDTSQPPNQLPSGGRTDGAPLPDRALPSTLETRRKKNVDSSSMQTKTKAQSQGSSPTVDTPQLLKPGSKRKFSPDGDGFLSDLAQNDDEFQFSRPSHSPQEQSDPFNFLRQDSSPSTTPTCIKREPVKDGMMKRKVLEPKSANVNLGSPKKVRATSNPVKKLPLDKAGDENTRSPVMKGLSNHNTKPPSQKARSRSTGLQKQKSSGRVNDSRETLPSQDTPRVPTDSPVAISAETSAGMSDIIAASRPSRRQRAVVSYAEPNLRDKMRRPTRELIDAVGGDGSRRSSSFQLVRETSGEDSDNFRGPGVSPRPPAGNIPADMALADQVTDVFGNDDGSSQLSVAVSRRRQSRRHSSNPEGNVCDVSPLDVDDTNTSARERKPPSTIDLQLNGDISTEWKSEMDASLRRETRVAARRKSMMV